MTDFYDYVLSFYGDDGIYPMGATPKLIKQATNDIIQILQIKNDEFCGDSFDRERVCELLITKYNMRYPE